MLLYQYLWDNPSQGTKIPLVCSSLHVKSRKDKLFFPCTRPVGRVLWKELLEVILHITPFMFFIGYTFKGQVHVFAG